MKQQAVAAFNEQNKSQTRHTLLSNDTDGSYRNLILPVVVGTTAFCLSIAFHIYIKERHNAVPKGSPSVSQKAPVSAVPAALKKE